MTSNSLANFAQVYGQLQDTFSNPLQNTEQIVSLKVVRGLTIESFPRLEDINRNPGQLPSTRGPAI
jgi:hypothetical protein